MNLPHCTRKILLSGDGQISLELRKVLDVPVVERRSPFHHRPFSVVPPDDRKRPPRALPFQSNFGQSIVALALSFVTYCTPPMQPDMRSVRAINPRTELLDPHAVWSMRSFFLVTLGPDTVRYLGRVGSIDDYMSSISTRSVSRLKARPVNAKPALPVTVMDRELPNPRGGAPVRKLTAQVRVTPVFASVSLEQACWRL